MMDAPAFRAEMRSGRRLHWQPARSKNSPLQGEQVNRSISGNSPLSCLKPAHWDWHQNSLLIRECPGPGEA